MMTPLAGALVVLGQAFAADAPTSKAAIYFSAAPWDGAAYALEIPLVKSADAAEPVIRVSIWGNPEFDKSETIRFSGREDPGGGPGKGRGIASYQTVFNRSVPQHLSGGITFESLKHGQPVAAEYDLMMGGGMRFKGRFLAAWGNDSFPGRGRASSIVATPKPAEKSFKGMELYSWKGPHGVWSFALLPGTNRLKTEDEVKKPENRIRGLALLKERLASLAKGEEVFWNAPAAGFELPDERIRTDIAAAAKKAGVELSDAGAR